MPPKPLPFREVRRRLRAAGFLEVSSRGSHVKFAKRTDTETFTAIVPRHDEVKAGTIKSIVRQAGLSMDEFDRL